MRNRPCGHSLRSSGTLLLALLVPLSPVAAGAPRDEFSYSNNPMGEVTFDHRAHRKKGLKCDDCHTQVFEESIGATPVSFDKHHENEACFSCHEVSYEETGNCMDCHTLGQDEPGG